MNSNRVFIQRHLHNIKRESNFKELMLRQAQHDLFKLEISNSNCHTELVEVCFHSIAFLKPISYLLKVLYLRLIKYKE